MFTLSQWVRFLAHHLMDVSDMWHITRVAEFETLDSTVYPSYGIRLVNIISDSYCSTHVGEMLLHRQVFRQESSEDLDFTLTPTYANIFILSIFP